jgi:MoaA/NifB/PqqE/SkfB family radical SAM enzyme
LRDLGVKEVVFSGGEPLLRHDIADIIKSATDLGLKTNLLSNGRQLDSSVVGELVKAGLCIITLSVDSLDNEIYQRLRGTSLDRVKESLMVLDDIERSKLHISLTCVITMLNLGSLTNLACFAQDHQMRIPFQPYNEMPSCNHPELLPCSDTQHLLEEAIDGLIRLKRKGVPILNSDYYLRNIPNFMLYRHSLLRSFHCIAGYISINIDSNLDVVPCWNLPAIGNLRKENLQSIWYSRSFSKTRQQMKRLECNGCWLICHTDRLPPA